jgi:hypothetical protein
MAKNLDDIKIVPDPAIHHPGPGSYEVDDWLDIAYPDVYKK